MRSTATMNIGACVGLKETLAANRPGNNNNDRYPLNQYIGKNFFDDENYRAALERLDGGYEISMDFIEWMQDYVDREREQARNHILYVDKWTTRLKQQSSLISYHTTKRAQLDTISITKELARLKETTCNEMQKVIDKYRNYVNEIYISERFRPGRKHCRTNEFKKSFKNAYTPLREISDQLEVLRTQEIKARDILHKADSACEILDLDPTANDKQRARANDVQAKKRAILKDIEEKILETKEKLKKEKKNYRIKATEIFKQCQYIEEERLEQIRETLLDFIQAMHTSKYSSELDEIFENLTKKITTQQNSFDDLLFWAKTYGIENKLNKSLTLTTNDNNINDNEEENIIESRISNKKLIHHDTSTKDKRQSIIETNHVDEDEPSVPISTTNSMKTKVKRTKSITTIDKKHDPSTTTNNTMLNQV